MPTVEIERTLVKSPPELWDGLAADTGLGRWIAEARVTRAEPPNRLEWAAAGTSGVIELEASGWGTKVRALAEFSSGGVASNGHEADLERRLGALLDDLGSSSLTSS